MRGRKEYWILAGCVIFVLMLMLLILVLQAMSIKIPSTASDSFEIGASIATVCAATGAFWTIYEARNTSAGELVLELQKEFSDSYGMKVYMKCWNEYSNKIYGETIELENKVKTLTFFETLYVLLSKGIFDIKDLDDLFGRRFFVIVNNVEIQKELVDKSQYYVNIYKLHAIWKKYRVERGESLFVSEGKSEAVELEYAVLAHLEKFEVLNENKAHLRKISKLYK